MNKKKVTYFTKNLLRWNKLVNNRQMPWKAEKDPYKIWLSEIILQQTRVEQGIAYYNHYVKKFPSVKHLAFAADEIIFKMWEGLGYYNRCKNLILTARYITKELNGRFPDNYDDILKLKGIGPYTASAIASFAYDLPYAVVDANVERVLSRFFGLSIPVGSISGKKFYTALATKLLDKKEPAIYNQTIMDFGATVCKPQNPVCTSCFLQSSCIAVKKNAVKNFPVKTAKMLKRNRWFYYFVVEFKGGFYIKKRTGQDIWQNLHEFILQEVEKETSLEKIIELSPFNAKNKLKHILVSVSEQYKQQLTHQTIHGRFLHIKTGKKILMEGYALLEKSKIQELAFPGLITKYFKGEGMFLIE